MRLGTLDALRRYPVKSLRGEALDEVEVAKAGIPGDRSRALVVRSGSARVGKTYRGKEDDRLHFMTSAENAAKAIAEYGIDVAIRKGEHYFDRAPISLLVDRWLDSLHAHVGYTVEWERFRPNMFVRAADGFAIYEASLVECELSLGEVRLRVNAPIVRCVVPTYDLKGGPNDARILRFIAQERGGQMGVYCDVVQPGTARIGDHLTLVEQHSNEAPFERRLGPHPGTARA